MTQQKCDNNTFSYNRCSTARHLHYKRFKNMVTHLKVHMLTAVCNTKILQFLLMSLAFICVPPGGAVYQVWDARPAEFYHQAEGGGGQRGPETSEKVWQHSQIWAFRISAVMIQWKHLSPLLVPAGIPIWGVWLKNSSVVFQKARHVGDLLFKIHTKEKWR